MISINKVILVGNVGKEVDIKQTNDGRQIANFTLATGETWKDKATGEKKQRTEWHRIVVFSEGLIDIIKNYIRKGTKIYIEGTLHTRKWNDNSGVEKYTTEVILQGYNCSLVILDSNKSDGNKLNDEISMIQSFDDLPDMDMPF